ncbi:acetoacetate decarboxylase family protein [Nocardioides terrisoli]|uniref:acetoacetate decarboxylase family protein n=1 Tax=Nocardioides terrisoli TaxID=3388267 RepID=UPI00287B745C|nr:acetoacetate decarboxylase family protein [Nocardioides marmorisolisilvae]
MTDSYPPAPWHMVGQLWLSLFRVRDAIDERRPAGTYGVAFVGYEEGSPLTYSELLVARPVKHPVKAVSITDIWVDSPASVAGGRELWAIPKGLADFTRESRRRAALSTTAWSASVGGTPTVAARFTDVSHLAPRLPFKGATWQPGLTEGIGAHGGDRTAALTGSSRTLPCAAVWDFNPGGPLGWLAGRRPLASFRMTDFSMSFG